MIKNILITLSVVCFCNTLFSQAFLRESPQAKKWVDSVFNKLTEDEKIAQLFIIRAHSNLPQEHIDKVTEQIKKYNVGGLCFFQGGPVRQANLTNYYQSIAKTPLLITIDAEWGVGMRLDSVDLLPKNMMLGAMLNDRQLFEVGKVIGLQCKRLCIHLNYAPVVDVNNNPSNPVINDRSLGENKINVAKYSSLLTAGIQSVGVMACAKHFPGHGDVAVDSHLDLPVINKPFKSIDNLELYPFKQQIKTNVGCVMTAHLSVPSIDNKKNTPTSLSSKCIKELLIKKLGFKGLIITDGLEMKGVKKNLTSGQVSAKAIIAGNDLLCLPEDLDSSIYEVKKAIASKELSIKQLNKSIKKVLLAKYNLGLSKLQSIDTKNLVEDINAQTKIVFQKISEEAITVVKQSNPKLIPLPQYKQPLDVLPNVAHIIIGNGLDNEFSKSINEYLVTDKYFFKNSFAATFKVRDSIEPKAMAAFAESEEKFNQAKNIIDSVTKIKNYDAIVISVHMYNRRPANNFGLDSSTVFLMQSIANLNNAITFMFGNCYAIKNICNAKNVIACFDDDNIVQKAAADILIGRKVAKGKLPVSVCNK